MSIVSGDTARSDDSGSELLLTSDNIPDTSLVMECEEEALTEVQDEYYKKKRGELKAVMARLEEIALVAAAQKTDNSKTLQAQTKSSDGSESTGQLLAGSATQQYRFMMNPKSGRIVGSLPQTPSPSPAPPTPRAATPTRGRGGRGKVINNQPQRSAPSPTARVAAPPTTIQPPKIVDLTACDVEPVGVAPSPQQPVRVSFPALSVFAKPQRAIPPAAAKRSELDAKVKALLVHPPSKFTEWLIQQGLVRSEQSENGVKLKLGMFSDAKKFPHSGGYVWIQDGTATKYTSVFRGSFFECVGSPPTVLLKLIYHWSCQTNITNIAQWVKVDNAVIDLVFSGCRSVCVGAVQDEVVGLGGPGKVVEVGVISLGTTTADGHKREVMVEVLGVLDRTTRKLRLRATEPIPGASQGERFGKIFELLHIWIHKSSKIVTDYSVDRETLMKLGFKNIIQCSLSQATGNRPENTNQQIMDYLKKVVPKMFQNSLSNLTIQVIQQFLDELTFREIFGQSPLTCFDGLIQKIATQTTLTAKTEETMVARMTRLAANPFLDWRLSVDKSMNCPVPVTRAVSEESTKTAGGDSIIETVSSKKTKLMKEVVVLENYYYASLPGERSVLEEEFKADMAFKCHICKKVFMNNLEFMKHLHLHVETDRENAIDMVDLSQCRYCYKDFDSEIKAQEHLEVQHLKTGKKYVCKICDQDFGQSTQLIQHMQKSHVCAEMPYVCQICSFRSSQHKDVIEHFQNNHERTDKLQCPHCLKTTGLYGEKGYNADTTVKFMQHLQKHEDMKSKNGLSCRKCVLKFVDEKSMKSHCEVDHVSYKDWEGLECCVPETGVQIALPDEKGMRMASKKSSSVVVSLLQQASFASMNLEDIVMYDVTADLCCECNKTMTMTGHYVAHLCCTKCKYSTSCSKAMSVHVSNFHSLPKPVFQLGKPVLLEQEMFCCCGFSSLSGNKLAKHLGLHGCKSVYPSKKEAEMARVNSEQNHSSTNNTEEGKLLETGLSSLQTDGSNDGEEDVITQDENVSMNECENFPKDGENIIKEVSSEKEIGLNNDERTDDSEKADEYDNVGVVVNANTSNIDQRTTAVEEEGDDTNTPKVGGGMLLFGTLFKYMKDKKDDDEMETNEKDSLKQPLQSEITENPDSEKNTPTVEMEENLGENNVQDNSDVNEKTYEVMPDLKNGVEDMETEESDEI